MNECEYEDEYESKLDESEVQTLTDNCAKSASQSVRQQQWAELMRGRYHAK